jgi:hypothetical protein
MLSEATDKLPKVLVAASSGFVNVAEPVKVVCPVVEPGNPVCPVGYGFSDFFLHPTDDNPRDTVMAY